MASVNYNFSNKALESFITKYDSSKTKVDVKGNKLKVDYDGDGRYDETINFRTKDLKYSYKEYSKETSQTKSDGKYTLIDYDNDGRYDAKIKSKKLSKHNMSNPITLNGNSREIQELTEQRYALEHAYSMIIDRDIPDHKEGQEIKKLMAEIDKKLNKYGAGVDTEEYKNRTKGLETVSEPERTESVPVAAPVEVITPVDETVSDAISEDETGFGKGSAIQVTNPKNPNGTIDGKLEDFEVNDEGMITKFTVKSNKSGNTFTYEYDATTKRYLNKAEGKYYTMSEDGTLVRDNRTGAARGAGGSDAQSPTKTMAESGSGRYAVTENGVTKYYSADGKQLKSWYYKEKEGIELSAKEKEESEAYHKKVAETRKKADELREKAAARSSLPSADVLKKAQSTFRDGGEFKVVKTYPDGSFDMSYDFGSWWNGGSGVRHYDKNGGLLGKAKKTETSAPEKAEITPEEQQKKKDYMNRFQAVETLNNGYTKRKLGSFNSFIYFNADGIQLSKAEYEKAQNAA